MTEYMYFQVRSKANPSRTVNVCLPCAAVGVDDDMIAEQHTFDDNLVEEPINCEVCGNPIAEPRETEQ